MVENLRSRLILIGAVLLGAVLLLTLNKPPFRLGLDLQGGTRYVFRVTPNEDQVDQATDPQQVIQESITVIRNRIDPTGTLEPVMRQEGKDRFVLELPGADELVGEPATGTLLTALPAEFEPGQQLLLENIAGDFPRGGGTLAVGDEFIFYNANNGGDLAVTRRGENGSAAISHAAGAEVRLLSTNAIQNKIENLGALTFQIRLSPEGGGMTGDLLKALGTDFASERQKIDDWLELNPGANDFAAFNVLPASLGGPADAVEWAPSKLFRDPNTGKITDTRTLGQRAEAVLRVDQHPDYADIWGEDWYFTGEKLETTYVTSDDLGYPAVGFKFFDLHAADFGNFTDEFRGEQLAVLLNGQLESAPSLNTPIYGQGIIQGRYQLEEVTEMVTVLRSGSLRIKPILVSKESVGPTLGAEYVKRGWMAGLAGILCVLGFMVFYYRTLGGIASVSLLVNMALLMGGLAFMRATLTLPGIAGIILTVGMAVDANILIFDRIREERDAGRNVKQAAKNGFDKALSTILDANITTLLTAIILFVVGTGPIKGFAVTLAIGILTSLFSALVVTKVLVHIALERGAEDFKVGTWLVEANFKWMEKAKTAFVISSIVIVGGLLLFASMPGLKKYGIDFTGGGTLQMRTEQAQSIDTIRTRVAGLGGELAKAEIKPILSSAEGSDGAGNSLFTDFRLTVKLDGQSGADEGSENEIDEGELLRSQVTAELADLLQKGPIEFEMLDSSRASLKLYFEAEHPTADIQSILESDAVGLTDVTVAADADRSRVYSVEAAVPAELTDLSAQQRVLSAFTGERDSANREYSLSQPIPNSSSVGAQVVGELRDKAILAIAFSLFAIVLYIRARFAEYSYGFAAVVALVHDVLVTLAALSVMMMLGILEVEISLPMIAAFLTIIGYSLNDTIVVFDRIRENRPRMEGSLASILDRSINQTLSRTILTSTTTFIAVVILFGANVRTGNTLEGFAFAMLVGIVVGTYSSVFIASPALLFFEERAANKRASDAENETDAAKPA